MKYIDKNNTIANETKQKIEDWKNEESTIHQGENPTIYKKDDLNGLCSNAGVSGDTVWKYLDNDGRSSITNKAEIKKSLLKEQGYICCYCGNRIIKDRNSSHIEHLIPKSKKDNAGNYVQLNKEKVYDYDNLLASCYGGSKNFVYATSPNETKFKIAELFDINIHEIEELYIEDTNYEIVARNYDLDNLKQGDKVWIIKSEIEEYYHCGYKKEDNEIFIYSTNRDCEQYFEYAKTGKMVGRNNDAIKTIEVLGLNSNEKLNIRRKAKLKEGEDFRELVFMQSIDPSMIKFLIEQKIESLYTPDSTGFLTVMCFVIVAAIIGRTS